MLHLQLPKWHKRNSFFTKLFLLSLFIHIFLVILLFFSYASRATFIFSAQQAPLSLAHVKLVAFSSQKTSQKIKNNVSHKSLAPVKKKATSLVNISKKVVQKNKQQEKVIAKKVEKKSQEKIAKIDNKQAKKEVVSVIKKESTSHALKSKREEIAQHMQDGALLSVTQKEYDALQAENDLQVALAQVWAPPVGIALQAESHVQVTVDWQGVVVAQEIVKKTHIALFDVAVQEALQEVKIPKQFWGKELTLIFKA